MCPCHVAFGAADLGGRTAFGVPLTGAFRSGCQAHTEVRSPVPPVRTVESVSLRLLTQVGGSPLLRLNTGGSPIADKYREGKLQSTLKREFKRT